MTAAERILTRTAALPLGTRTLLRFRGPDRLRYLNGQLTNDLREIPADQSIHSCVTDAKGRLLADLLLAFLLVPIVSIPSSFSWD